MRVLLKYHMFNYVNLKTFACKSSSSSHVVPPIQGRHEKLQRPTKVLWCQCLLVENIYHLHKVIISNPDTDQRRWSKTYSGDYTHTTHLISVIRDLLWSRRKLPVIITSQRLCYRVSNTGSKLSFVGTWLVPKRKHFGIQECPSINLFRVYYTM